ncbi:hypothetical protein Tco_0954222 [Tanacetum coccineum]|uniref:Uncharacterized protein n=1 Tax=Tanacetum coccineum TaxID=301880 RepID=A0ABQ5E257_9ASTR
MAQHVIPAAQLVPQYKPIGRCNNYAVLQSIPCSPECKIVGLILLDHCLSHALTATADVPAVYLQQFWRTMSKVPDTEDTIKFLLDTEQFTYTVDIVAKIRETDDFKEYNTVFMKVAILMNQPQPIVSTQGANRTTPRAHRSPTVFAGPLKTKKRKQTDGESKPGSRKDNLKFVDDDDDDKAEEKHSDDMGSLEIRNEETQTTIPTLLSSPRKILSLDKKTSQELTILFQTQLPQHPNIHKSIKEFPVNTLIVQERFAGCAGVKVIWFKTWKERKMIFTHIMMNIKTMREKRVKRSKGSKRSKYARGSLSKHSSKDSTKYVSKQQCQQQEWDAWEEENVINDDEVIPKDDTPELIVEFQNVYKRVPTIFDHATMKATLRDSLSNQSRNAEEYAYHLDQSTNFMEN